jgi:SAM-dependent methyltransferase
MERELTGLLVSCPACDETTTKKLGPLREICGAIDLYVPGHLYQCDSCTLLFRHPYILESDLEKAYENYSSNTWADTRERSAFNLSAGVIRSSFEEGNVLDIGCFQGDFLKRLPDTYQKFGIEPSNPAREIARKRGIDLVGYSIHRVVTNCSMFHAITLLDVFEHLPRPIDALKKSLSLLLPGGIIIVATGNSDYFLWRLMRRDYWYYFPEHVVFANPRWFRWAAKQLNLDIIMVRTIPHIKGSISKKCRQVFNCFVYWLFKHIRIYDRLFRTAGYIYPFSRVKKWTSAPLANLLPDHILVVLKSKAD